MWSTDLVRGDIEFLFLTQGIMEFCGGEAISRDKLLGSAELFSCLIPSGKILRVPEGRAEGEFSWCGSLLELPIRRAGEGYSTS